MSDPMFEGVYGPYSIDADDRRDVLIYRLALLLTAVAQLALLVQWRWGSTALLWPWLGLMAAGIGLALRYIHIYLRPLHRLLQLLWLLGCLGVGVLAWRVSPATMAATLARQPMWVLAVGPLFAALTGIGFKEFFCFQRLEAIGVTLLLPAALLGYLSGWLKGEPTLLLLAIEAALLLLLALRKFPMPAAADVGDKSVFAHLEALRQRGSAGMGGEAP